MKSIPSLLLAGIIILFPGIARAEVEEKRDVTLNLPKSRVADVLAFYEQLTGVRTVRELGQPGPEVSLIAPAPMTRAEAVRFIEAFLSVNGYTLMPVDARTVKVVAPAAGKTARTEGAPLYANAADLPTGEQIVSYYMPLRYMTAQEASQVFLQHVKAHPSGSIVPIASAQAIVITDNGSVIRQLVRLQDLMDAPPAKTESEFVTLKRADAERVAEAITRLIESRKMGGSVPPVPADGVAPARDAALLSGEAQLLPDARTNRILVVARPVHMGYLRDLIHQFDEASVVTKPVEIALQYEKAADVLPVLRTALVEGRDEGGDRAAAPNPSRSNTASPDTAPSATGTGSSLTRPDRLAAPADSLVPESIIVGKTRVIADKKANSILVMGPPESVEKVRSVLRQLDKRPMQVYLSAVIGQLTLGDGSELGVDLLQKFSRRGDSGVASGSRMRSGTGDTVPEPTSLLSSGAFPLPSGLTVYGAIGNTLAAYVKALETTNRFKVISRPSIYTANNTKAVISSGQKVAVPTSTLSSLTTGSTNNTAVSASIDYRDVVLKLEVLPLINSNREVTLQIAEQNDSIVGSQTISGNTVPTIGTQEINTRVTMPDGATVVLGGLISDSESRDTTGVPWISRVPLLGLLFKDTQKSRARSELIILLQPRVIESPTQLVSLDEIDRAKVGGDAISALAPKAESVGTAEEFDDDSPSSKWNATSSR